MSDEPQPIMIQAFSTSREVLTVNNFSDAVCEIRHKFGVADMYDAPDTGDQMSVRCKIYQTEFYQYGIGDKVYSSDVSSNRVLVGIVERIDRISGDVRTSLNKNKKGEPLLHAMPIHGSSESEPNKFEVIQDGMHLHFRQVTPKPEPVNPEIIGQTAFGIRVNRKLLDKL